MAQYQDVYDFATQRAAIYETDVLARPAPIGSAPRTLDPLKLGRWAELRTGASS